MKRKYQALLLTAGILTLTFMISALYVFYKPHTDISGVPAKYAIEAAALVDAYLSDEQSANKMYLNQVVEVKGVVVASGQQSVALGTELKQVNCTPQADKSFGYLPTVGDTIVMKGICTGLSLTDVCLSSCTIVK